MIKESKDRSVAFLFLGFRFRFGATHSSGVTSVGDRYPPGPLEG
jgi:hypothetical protein